VSAPGALDEAVQRIAARHGRRQVGLVVGAVTGLDLFTALST
jgi:tetrahydromethanopterin S-methyltransferase subunit G